MAKARHASGIEEKSASRGEDDDWRHVTTRRVHKSVLDTPEGREVALTKLMVFKHRQTGEQDYELSEVSESMFVFDEEWPADDTLMVGGQTYHPASMFMF